MSADAAGLVQLAEQAQRRAAQYAPYAEGLGAAAVVESINGLTYAVLALVAVSTPEAAPTPEAEPQQSAGPGPRCRLGRPLALHTQPCEDGCEYPPMGGGES